METRQTFAYLSKNLRRKTLSSPSRSANLLLVLRGYLREILVLAYTISNLKV